MCVLMLLLFPSRASSDTQRQKILPQTFHGTIPTPSGCRGTGEKGNLVRINTVSFLLNGEVTRSQTGADGRQQEKGKRKCT